MSVTIVCPTAALFVLLLSGCSRDEAEVGARKGGAAQSQSPIAADADDSESSAKADPYEDIVLDTPVIHRTMAGELDADGWCVAESTRGHFSVALPGPFADYMLKSRTTTGGLGVLHTVVTKDDEGTEFSVLQAELIGERPPAETPLINSVIKRLEAKGATISTRAIEVASLPAERLSARAPGVSAEMVFFSSGSSDYLVSVQWHERTAESLEKDIDRFLSSFELTKSEK